MCGRSSPDKAFFRRNTKCISRKSNEVWRKRCRAARSWRDTEQALTFCGLGCDGIVSEACVVYPDPSPVASVLLDPCLTGNEHLFSDYPVMESRIYTDFKTRSLFMGHVNYITYLLYHTSEYGWDYLKISGRQIHLSGVSAPHARPFRSSHEFS